MPDNSAQSKHQEVAKTQVRDGLGKFIKTEASSQSDHLVDVKIHNPLKKIEQLIDDIRRRQTTQFAFKANIPLIALPAALALLFGLGGFQLGKIAAPVCLTRTVTRLGTLHVLTILVPDEPTWLERLTPWLGSPKRREAQTAALLEEKSETSTVKPAAGVSLVDFNGQRVAVTGTLNPCTEILSLETAENITKLQ